MMNFPYFFICESSLIFIFNFRQKGVNVDEVMGCNGVSIDRKEVILKFADSSMCPNLHNKPKLFFFQVRQNDITLHLITHITSYLGHGFEKTLLRKFKIKIVNASFLISKLTFLE